MSKKRVYNKSTGRDYKYDTEYQSSPEQRKNRSNRNKARREIFNALKDKVGEAKAKQIMNGKDVDHKKPIKDGGSNNRKNLRLISKSKNRARK